MAARCVRVGACHVDILRPRTERVFYDSFKVACCPYAAGVVLRNPISILPGASATYSRNFIASERNQSYRILYIQ
jgi:hypothetical protein